MKPVSTDKVTVKVEKMFSTSRNKPGHCFGVIVALGPWAGPEFVHRYLPLLAAHRLALELANDRERAIALWKAENVGRAEIEAREEERILSRRPRHDDGSEVAAAMEREEIADDRRDGRPAGPVS